jgi:serine/threonine protein phosphatase 1
VPHLKNLHRFTLDRFSGPGSEEVFAIGDIHGRADLLDLALDAIAATPAAEGRTRRLVTLGDYIDRGPEGVRVIDLLMAAPARLGFPVTNLLGNHEQMIVCALSDDLPHHLRKEIAQCWASNGGIAVISELVEAGHDLDPPYSHRIADALGPERLAFLRGLARSHTPPGSDVLFVHAGLNPNMPLGEFLDREWRIALCTGDFQEKFDPSWVRGPFLDHRPADAGKVGHHGHFVVHGHTPQDGLQRSQEFQVDRDRINLDAYAVFTGRLRVARFVGNVLETFEVTMPERGPEA